MKLAKGTKIALWAVGIYALLLSPMVIVGFTNHDPTMPPAAWLAIWAFNVAFWLGIIGLWRWKVRPPRARPELRRYCTRCGAVEERMFYARGSWLVCIFLCCLFLIPGIFYFAWMRSTEHYGCQKCGSPDIVPLDSPVALRSPAESQGPAV